MLKRLGTCVTLVAVTALLSSCATMGTIPGVSLVVDAMEASRLAEALQNDEIGESEAAESMRRPTPPPPGISFDVAMIRRMTAAFVLGDYQVITTSHAQVIQHSKSIGSRRAAISIMAAAEAARGNLTAALRLYEGLESERRVAQGRTTPSGMDMSAIALHLDTALFAGRADIAERLVKDYYGDGLDGKVLADYRRSHVYVRGLHYRAKLAELRGDPLEARNAAMNTLDEQRKLAARFPSANMRERREIELLLDRDLAMVVRTALATNEFGLARTSLDELRKRSGTGDKGRLSVNVLRQAEAEYFIAIGRYDDAAKSIEDQARSMPVMFRNSTFMSAGISSSAALSLAAAGKYVEAQQRLAAVTKAAELGASDVRRTYWVTLTLVNALGGKHGQSLTEFDAIESQLAERSTSPLAMGYFGVKALAYHRRSVATRSDSDLLKAIDGGRQFSRAYRAARASGVGRNLSLPEPLLRHLKEAYVLVASQVAGRGGTNLDDLLDATALAQESDTEDDVGAAVARQRSIPGLSSQQLRQFQDLRQRARAAQRQAQDLATAEDVEPRILAEALQRANETSHQLTSLIPALRQSSPNLAQAFGVGPPKAAEIQAKLAAGEAMVIFLPMQDATLAIQLSRRGMQHRVLPASREVLFALVKALRAGVTFGPRSDDPLPAFDSSSARELHRRLFGWLERGTESMRELTVVAGGPLASIPFSLLIARDFPSDRASDFKALSWLARTTAISHAPSIASWLAIADNTTDLAPGGFLAWADPKFNAVPLRRECASREATTLRAVRGVVRSAQSNEIADTIGPGPDQDLRLEELCETREEAASIARVLRASPDGDVITGAKATRASVLAASQAGTLAQRRVVMFATHGLTPDQSGFNQPALALAREFTGTPQLSLLLLDDVVSLRLNAEWLLLSACNTASADRDGGDALSGLARGFFFAGARTLLVTHWAVESKSAAEITKRTMEAQAADPRLSRAQALQRASLDLLEGRATSPNDDWSHPVFWAPYAVVGDGRRAAQRR